MKKGLERLDKAVGETLESLDVPHTCEQRTDGGKVELPCPRCRAEWWKEHWRP